MANTEHAIKIWVSPTGGCDPTYWIWKTDEKYASGGTYWKNWPYPGKDVSGFTAFGKNK